MNTLCKKCGKPMDESANFCGHCGYAQKAAPTQIVHNETDEAIMPTSMAKAELTEIKSDYQLQKRKYIGYFNYSTITTRVHLAPSCMEVVQEKKSMWSSKEKVLDAKIEYADIHDIVVKKTMGKYCMFWIIVCCVLGVLVPITFLTALVIFWIGYGKKVHILTSKTVYPIPTEAGSELNELLAAIKVIQPAIFIKG